MGITKLTVENKTYPLKINKKNSNTFSIEIRKKIFEVKIIKIDVHHLFFEINGSIYKAKLIEKSPKYLFIYIFNLNKTFKVETQNQNQNIEKVIPANLIKSSQIKKHSIKNFSDSLRSPLAGKIIKVCVQPNELVHKNQPLLVIESMKMENEIRAQYDTFIKTIQIYPQDLVQQDQLLMTFEKRGEFYAKTKVTNEQEEI